MKTRAERQLNKLMLDGEYSGLMAGFVRHGRGWRLFHGRSLQEVDLCDLAYTAGWIFGKLLQRHNLHAGVVRLLRRWHRQCQAEILARKLARS